MFLPRRGCDHRFLAGLAVFLFTSATFAHNPKPPTDNLATNNSAELSALEIQKQSLDSFLAAMISKLDESLTLSPAQKLKFRLAGSGDVKRYLQSGGDRFAQDHLDRKWKDLTTTSLFSIRPLHRTSLLYKTVRNILTEEQMAIWRPIDLKAIVLLHEKHATELVDLIGHVHPFQEGKAIRVIDLLVKQIEPCSCDDVMSVYAIAIASRPLLERTGKKYLTEPQMSLMATSWHTLSEHLERQLRLDGYFPETDLRSSNP